MRDFGLIVDSTVQSNFKEVIFKDASIVSLSFILNEQVYRDGQISNDVLFEDKAFKKASLIDLKPEDFIKAIHTQKALGYEKVLLLLSANLITSAYNQALLAKTILKDNSIYIIDTNTFGPGIEFLLEMLDYYVKKQLKFNDILDKMNEKIKQGQTLILTKTLTKLKIEKSKFDLPKLLVSNNLVSLNKNFVLEKQFLYKTDPYGYLVKMIQTGKHFGIKSYVKIFYATDVLESKVLHHELHSGLSDANVTLYGGLSCSMSLLFGKEALGIYIGNEEV